MSPIEKILNDVDWKPTSIVPNGSGLPWVTHEGVIHLGELSLRVLQLSNGQRIIPTDELDKLFIQ